MLGRSFDAVVLDLHDGLDADLLGQCHGLVRGGGTLILRMPEELPPLASLAVAPFTARDVGTRFPDRFERLLAAFEARAEHTRHESQRGARASTEAEGDPPSSLASSVSRSSPLPRFPVVTAPPAPPAEVGTPEQARTVSDLATTFANKEPALAVLIADRGRGKSSALGLALGRTAGLRAVVTAPSREAAAEVFRFAPGVPFVEPLELVTSDVRYDAIVVDEAAQLPVPLLRAIAQRHHASKIAFATTTHGYEGTGRGFVLRFLEWLREEGRPLVELTLRAPIRWDEGDPLERFVFDVLALDAEIASAVEIEEPPAPRVLDRDRLAEDEPLLRGLFGLLVHAHYRTTPNDLLRLLDAPNLAVHAIVEGSTVLAATLVAMEGGLDRATCERLAAGRERIRGHALADTLITHAGRPDAGELSIVRSVRIATHPAVRRRGLARLLVDHVHRTYAPDLFGTLFGATPELLRFRCEVGYALVRVGVSRGARTGEPAAVMLRAGSPRGAALIAELRAELARDLPIQLALLDADGELGLDPELAASLSQDVERAVELGADAVRARVLRYLAGPQPFEAAAYAITRFVEAHHDRLASLEPRERALIEGRVIARRPWRRAASDAGYPTTAAAMRALRPAIRSLARDPISNDD